MKKISIRNKNEKFSNCSISDEEAEGRLIAVNEKFLAISNKNKNSEEKIIIVDSSQSKKIKSDLPGLNWKNKKIYDIEFSPFNNNLLASCYEDNSVLLWDIPENGLDKTITKEKTIYNKHNNRVNFVNFNPSESDKICSSTCNGDIHVWNLEKKDNYISLKADNNLAYVYWNPKGSLIGASSKNNFNIFDPRFKDFYFTKCINEHSPSFKFVWVDDYSFSTIV